MADWKRGAYCSGCGDMHPIYAAELTRLSDLSRQDKVLLCKGCAKHIVRVDPTDRAVLRLN